MDNNHQELYHYGVLGMKWGIRKKRKNSVRKTKNNIEPHEDYKKVHDSKSVKMMSDAELRQKLNRLQMEAQYNKLANKDVNKGKDFVKNAIKATGTVAGLMGSIVAIDSNYDKIKDIIERRIGR